MSDNSLKDQNTNVENEKKLSFADLGLRKELCFVCQKIGWKSPTPIQISAIPPALEGNDIIGLAETGSGKTGAFGLAMLQALLNEKTKKKPFGVVLTPTRELAIQIKDQFSGLGAFIGLQCVAIVGGVSFKEQRQQLQKNPHIVVATPGRLIDHLEKTKGFSLSTAQYLVLDEADRILSMDFEEEVYKIMSFLPDNRKTLLFSATITKKVETLSLGTLKSPVKVEVSKKYQTVKGLKEYMLLCPDMRKYQYLVYVLGVIGSTVSTIIFCGKRDETMKLSLLLRNLGIKALPLHGKLHQVARNSAINKFKASIENVLIATDVASRGLDLPKVDYVINFDLPANCKDYIHRVGRTARAGKTGTSITFLTQYTVMDFMKIEETVGYKMDPYDCPKEEVLMIADSVNVAANVADKQLEKMDDDGHVLYKKHKKKVEESTFMKKLSEHRLAQKRKKQKKK